MRGGLFNAITFYRAGCWMRGMHIPIIPRVMEILIYVIFKSIIPLSANIGKGTFCSHRGISVVLHRRCSVGNDCIIGTCVTLGGRHEDAPGGPTIGNRVYIGTGAKILGPISVGDDVKIGANAVVLADIPAGKTAVGIPAKIID